MRRSVCVFCGASPGRDGLALAAARELGTLLARRGVRLVYGGGGTGVMGGLADATLAAGGTVIGVIPRRLADRELAHPALTELVYVETMHERKARMATLSDAFMVLPGGLGTLEELFEVWSWAQLGFHDKPIGVLDVGGYFRPLVAMMQHAHEQGFLGREDLDRLLVDDDTERLLSRLG